MKRHGNLWDQITSIDNLLLAHHEAKKGKSHYSEVIKTEQDVNRHIAQVREMLINKTFSTGDYKIQDRIEGGKMRRIYKLPYFPDRIVQHALIAIIGPIFRQALIRDTFQSLPCRGTSDARRRMQKAMTGPDVPKYALKVDIKKYYPSINNAKLKLAIRRKIKCQDTLWLVDNIIDSMDGIPIGNLTSQYFGNIYLSQFDWWVKQNLKAKHYFRYCDDLILLCNDKAQLKDWRNQIVNKLADLDLVIKPDWQIYGLQKQGVDFVGYVFQPNHTRLRVSIAKRFKEAAIMAQSKAGDPKKIMQGLIAYKGWVMRSNSKMLWRRFITKKVIKWLNPVFSNNPIKGAI